ncbi:MAG: hypothetical protein EOP11_06450 [Proteobacteria bacterium]|nr:MAG: hypothetical protein EOP11_06450 [Pseudomonadota bacterium]
MEHIGASPLRPLLRILEPAFREHTTRIEEHEAWRTFDEKSARRLAQLGFFHARDLCFEYANGEGPRAHWPLLSQFFEEAAGRLQDFAFTASLGFQGGSTLELWRNLNGEDASFVEGDRVLAFGRGENPKGLGRLDETFLVGAAALVANAPRATHFIGLAEVKGQATLLAFARDEAVITEELTPRLPGFFTGSAGELALHGAEVLADDIKLSGVALGEILSAHQELEHLILASVALGAINALSEKDQFPLLRVRLSLEGIIALQREACYGDAPRYLNDFQLVSRELLLQLPEALREAGNSAAAAKLARDLSALPLLCPWLSHAASTSKREAQVG